MDEFSRLDPAKLGMASGRFLLQPGQRLLPPRAISPRPWKTTKKACGTTPTTSQAKKNFELTLKKIQEQKQQQQQPGRSSRTTAGREPEQQKQKYNAMMQFLNQNEKQQMEKKKRKISAAKNEKDW